MLTRPHISHALLAAMAVFFSMPMGKASSQRQPHRVLMLHAYNYAFPATTLVSQSARARLLEHSQLKIEIEADFLDLARRPEPGYAQLTANYLREKYARTRFDAVLAVGIAAVPFLIRHRDAVAPGAPIIFVGGTSSQAATMDLPPYIVGVTANFEPERTIELAERLQPNARRLVVIGGSTELDQVWQLRTREAIERRKPKFETAYWFDRSYNSLLIDVSQLATDAMVLLLSVYADSDGKRLIPREVASEVAKASPAPVYGIFETYLGTGAVGGYFETYASMGEAAAAATLSILAGTDVTKLDRQINAGRAFRVDARAMERWHLSERNLPQGSITLFSVPTVWDLYRWHIIGLIAVVAFQALLLAGLLLQRARRKTAEEGVREKESTIRGAYEQVRQLAGRLIGAQEEERTRIARELHDDVGQRLASLSIGLSGLKRRVPESNDTVRDEVAGLQQQTMDLAKDLRNLSHELHPGALEHIGLLEALRSRCVEATIEANADIHLAVADGWVEVADDIKLCLYRVAQEALRNIERHAHAKTARIFIARQNSQVLMTISDDGAGFDTSGAARHQGIGLSSMGERVRMLGGSFEVHSIAGSGTTVSIRLPTGERP